MAVPHVREAIRTSLAGLPPGPLLVAFSGGLDSHVLLHVLASLPEARERGLRAIHIDHGLHEDSPRWAEQCRGYAAALDVELHVAEANVLRRSGLGLEASARRARYSEIGDVLTFGEIVALAHHRDDQTETVLLKLLRGAGPEGIGAMRTLRRLGRGWAWRPMLLVPRAALREYAEEHHLGWINDPGNLDPTIDRNYLRMQVMPRITHRWPEAESSIAQSANWARAAADFIDGEAARMLVRLQSLVPSTLRFREWLELPAALRDPVLRRWLRSLDLPEPTHFQASELVRQLAEAGDDRQPCVRWPGTELRRYRDLLYALAPLQFPSPDWSERFTGRPLALPLDLGTLRIADADRELAPPWQARFRRGGEQLRLAGLGHARDLRDLLQEAGIPPWQRSRLPLLYAGTGTLVAVADLWLAEEGQETLDAIGGRIEWEAGDPVPVSADAPPIDLGDIVS